MLTEALPRRRLLQASGLGIGSLALNRLSHQQAQAAAIRLRTGFPFPVLAGALLVAAEYRVV